MIEGGWDLPTHSGVIFKSYQVGAGQESPKYQVEYSGTCHLRPPLQPSKGGPKRQWYFVRGKLTKKYSSVSSKLGSLKPGGLRWQVLLYMLYMNMNIIMIM